jgi:O-antigen ligase
MPRFGGLAPHPVAMGMFAQTALLLIWARPYGSRWINVLAWITGLAALFLAQSKTAWIAFVLCSAAMWIVRNGGRVWERITDPRDSLAGVVACLAVMTVVGAVLGLLLASDVGSQLSDFADTSEGAQLMSMTGRDRIWAIAIEEWHANQLFGYGPGLWDADFRQSIGMPNATDAHNQFMDTLARGGTVGFVGLVIYSLVLLVLAFRHARATGGLSLALFLALALRSISEVPLLLFGYGTELYVHFLLLVTIAAGSAQHAVAKVPRARFVYGAAS